MPMIYEGAQTAAPMSEAEREKVREQLNRLLDTHHFKNSRRYPALLRFVVEETLEGRGEYLKERLLGIRVFDRPADYDTAADPIVRVTIAEIRKRIAQYYHDEEHDAEMRIELLPGRYAPEFRARSQRQETLSLQTQTPETVFKSAPSPLIAPLNQAAEPAVSLLPAQHVRPRRKFWYVTVAAMLVVLAASAVPLRHWLRPSALALMWAPLLDPQHTVLFCVPTDVGAKRGPGGEIVSSTTPNISRKLNGSHGPGQTFLDYETIGENVVYSDMLATLRIASLLAAQQRDYTVRLTIATTLEDLRQGPSVLVGGLDNPWAMRTLAPLRFHFAGSDEDRYWIADNQNPANKQWSLDLKQLYGSVDRDYAIIARVHSQQTGQPEMIIAGIGMSGTAAAGEFITDERRMNELRRRIGAGFKDHDFEAVISTDVVNGIAGSPRILAVSVL